MAQKIRARLTFSNVVAVIALFAALGLGTAWALERNEVKSRHIAPNAARGVDVRESSLAKVPDANLLDGLDSADLARGAADGRETNETLASGVYRGVLQTTISTPRSATLFVTVAASFDVTSESTSVECYSNVGGPTSDNNSLKFAATIPVNSSGEVVTVWGHNVGAGTHEVWLWCRMLNSASTAIFDEGGMVVDPHY